jgi:hypothetical protein
MKLYKDKNMEEKECHDICGMGFTRVKLALVRKERDAKYLVVTEEKGFVRHGLIGGHSNEPCCYDTLLREMNEELNSSFTKGQLNEIITDRPIVEKHETEFNKTLVIFALWNKFDPYYYNERIHQQQDSEEDCKKEVTLLREVDVATKKTPEGKPIVLSAVAKFALDRVDAFQTAINV